MKARGRAQGPRGAEGGRGKKKNPSPQKRLRVIDAGKATAQAAQAVPVPTVELPIIHGIEGLVDLPVAAAFLKVKRSWLYSQTSSPASDLPVYRVGGRFIRFRLTELLAWSRRDGGGTPLDAETRGAG